MKRCTALRYGSYFENKYYQLPTGLAKAPTVTSNNGGDFLKFQQSPQAHCGSL
jgi:hypothetical protein